MSYLLKLDISILDEYVKLIQWRYIARFLSKQNILQGRGGRDVTVGLRLLNY